MKTGLQILFVIANLASIQASVASAAPIRVFVPLISTSPVPGSLTILAPVDFSHRPISLRFSAHTAVMTDIGDTLQLKVAADLANGQQINLVSISDVVYDSPDNAIAGVSSTGLVSAAGSGDVSIAINYAGIDSNLRLMVRPGSVITSIEPISNLEGADEIATDTVPARSLILYPGDKAPLEILAHLDTGESDFITHNASTLYSSQNPGVATVDSNGIITAIGLGEALITATSHGVSTTSMVQVLSPDILPPITQIAFSGASFLGPAGVQFVSPTTLISFPASDPDVDAGVFSAGVATIRFDIDTTTNSFLQLTSAFNSAFSLGQGTHTIIYAAVDDVGNVEALHFSSIAVDGGPPITELQVFGSSATAADGSLIISTSTPIGFAGVDPLSSGVASGFGGVFFSLDNGVFQSFQSTFTLSEGFHSIAFYGVDNVANAEIPKRFSAFFGATPSTAAWTGLAGDGNWHTPGNWQPQKVPGPNDTAVVATRDTVAVSSGASAPHIRNLVLGDQDGLSAPILVISTGIFITGQATLHKNSLLLQDTTTLWRIGMVTMLAGSKLEHNANMTVRKAVLNLNIPGDFDLQAGASITLSALGFASSLTGGGGIPGFGPGASAGSSGAGYGGPGGQTQGGQAPGGTYGSIVEPVDLGSGGGGGDNHPGGFGGGALLLQVGGTLKLNGVIAANGGGGIFYSNPCCGGTGGGSGGTVNIRTNNLTGTGSVSADGGAGSSSGGGGGGGRIALRITGTDTSNLILSAAYRFASGPSGGSGTIYVQRPGQNPALIVKSPAATPAGSFTPISSASVAGSSLTLSDFTMGSSMAQFIGLTAIKITGMAAFTGANTIRNITGENDFPGGPTGFPAGSDVTIATMTFPAVSTLTLTGTTLRVSSLTALGHVILSGNSTLQQDSAVEWTIGSLSIGNGSKLTHKANASQKLHAVNVRILGAMTVDAGGSVNADGLGFSGGSAALPGFGPGGGAGSAVNGGAGGGYGGNGGSGQGGVSGGLAYGSVSFPDDLGSGGGGSNGVLGGAGGGEIVLAVGATLTVNGTLSANGISGNTNSSYGGGGGAGGTIRVSANNLAGSGAFTVNGGNGAAGSVAKGGGGAGGRISGAALFTGTLQAAGGVSGGTGAEGGQAGTNFDPALFAPAVLNPAFLDVSASSLTVRWSANGNFPGTFYLVQLSRFPDFSQAVSSITANTFATFENLSPNSLFYARAVSLSRGLAAAQFTALGSTQTLRLPGETWVGPSGGDWNTASNWDNGMVPVSTDPVTIDGNVTVVTYATNPAVAFGALTLGKADGSTLPNLILSTGTASSASSVVVHPNAVLTFATLAPVRLASVTLKPGAKLTHKANTNSKNFIANLEVSGDFDLQPGASITLTGQGFASSLTGGGGIPGFGPGASAGSSGAGYGGPGGQTFGGQGPGQAYGSIVEPVDLGSGGGGGDNHPGGFGGGALLLAVGGTLKLNGVIAANGGGGIFYSNPCCGGTGGGSGGTVNIRANNLMGTGSVSADGGAGSSSGGGGGGGRIALRITGTDTSNLILSAAYRFATGPSGGSGTIYVQRPGQAPALIVQSPAATPAGAFTPISSANVAGSSLTLSDFTMGSSKAQFIGLTTVKITGMAAFTGVNTISNTTGENDFPGGPTGFPAGSDVTIATMTFPAVSTLTLTGTTLRVSSLTALGHVILSGNSTLQQDSAVQWTIGSLSIGNGSRLTHKANTTQKLYMVNARVLGSMTVDAGGKVLADGLGFAGGASGQAGQGLGGGAGSAVNGGAGGGYGGNGGIGQGGTLGGLSYGSFSAPDDLGSGGGGSSGVSGGAGGGEITLSIGGILTVNGALSANGISGNTNSSYGAGGGAGGTIRINANGLLGAGLLQVNGGSGSSGSVAKGGGGAGGRISGAALFAGTIQASGGTKGGTGAEDGQAGSSFDPAIFPAAAQEPAFLNTAISSLTVQWNANGNLPGTFYLAQLSRFPDFSQAISSITANTFATFDNLNSNSLFYARAASLSRGLAAADFTALGSTRTLKRSGETWVGPSGGDWNNASNWDNGMVPISTDPVTIDGNASVVTYATNPPVAFASLTLGKADGSTLPNLILATGTAFGASSVIVQPNAILTLATLAPVRLESITLKPGAKLTHKANTNVKNFVANLEVSGDFDLQAGASITLSGVGFASSLTGGGGIPGFGPGASAGSSGAGYGGPGGQTQGGQAPGGSYGSIVEPVDLGSGGGGGDNHPGGFGGGALLLQVGGTLKLNGVIAANGGSGTFYSNPCCGGTGGGSGGTLNIRTNNLTGTGSMSADGGAGSSSGGGGGGGRIALRITGTDTSNLILSAAYRFATGPSGGSGTIFVQRPGQNPSLIVQSPAATPAGSFTPISSANVAGSSLTLSDFTMGSSKAQFIGLTTVKITGMAAFTGVNTISNTTGENEFPGGPTGFPAGSDVTIATMTFPAVSTLTLTGTILRVSSLTALGHVILSGNSTLQQDSAVQWTIGSLAIGNGSKLTHKANTTQKLYRVNARVLGNMTVDAGGTINVDGLGFSGGPSALPGFGPGAGAGSSVNGGGGASYGGNGGSGHGGTFAGTPYGSVASPDDLGSGGGGSNGVLGGAGGGEISLSVGGTLTVNGTISAKGIVGNTNSSYGGGGGSGGTIYLSPLALAGTGELSAAGASGGAGSVRGGGGGSGGRISFSGLFDGTATVAGGAGGGLAQAGGFGTIGPFSVQSTQTVGALPEASVSASQNVSLALVEAVSSTGTLILATAAVSGIYPVSNIYNLGPEGVLFSPALLFTFRYSTTTLAAFNIFEADIFLYQFVPGTGLVKVPGQVRDVQRKEITVQISMLASNFAIFGTAQDVTAPLTTRVLSGAQFTDALGQIFIASSTLVGFSAVDPIVNSTASGVALTEYREGAAAAPFQTFIAPFNLAPGPHEIEFRSQDNAGNLEDLKIGALLVDSAPPVTGLHISSPLFVGQDGVNYVTPETLIVFTAIDPVSGAVASGVAFTQYSLNGAEFQFFTSTFTLPNGSFTLVYRSRDNVGNTEAENTARIVVATVAPSITIFSPQAGQVFTAGRDVVLASFTVTDNLGNTPRYSAAFIELEDRGTPRGGAPALMAVTTGQAIPAAAFDDGVWQLTVSATDFLLNNAFAVSGVFEVVHDTLAPRTEMIIGQPQAAGAAGPFVTRITSMSLSSIDDLLSSNDGAGLGVAFQQFTVDGATRSLFVNQNPASGQVFSSSFTLDGDADGLHVLSWLAQDVLGNAESVRITTVTVDSTPPSSVLTVLGSSRPAGGAVWIEPLTPLLLTATDAASGVGGILLSINASSFVSSTAPFALAAGTYTLAFYSLDNVGNQEAPKNAELKVQYFDTTAPLVRLDFPGSSGLGVEQAVGGVVHVRGAVVEDGAVSWTLETATGAAASGGFTPVASGAGNITGQISAWNTAGLSGYHTLRLRAVDARGNVASVSATVFVGRPVFTFAIGRKDSNVIVSKMKNPTGIAVRQDGLIWVASTNEDEVILLTSSGAVITGVESHGFKNPQGLALDAENNLYIADKGNDRILKLSPDGSQVLLQIARLDSRGKPKVGSGPGELRAPQDVAVDVNGDIYAADSGNHRIQVFNSSGTFLRQFGPGVLLSTSQVRGIALTAEGLWVSDKELERVFLFSRSGILIKSIGDADSVVGELSRMRGLATDRLGALYVIEPNRDRAQKFDPRGRGLLAFGSKAGLSNADKRAKRYLTQPIDAAIAPDGSIWITDTGRDRIVRYALPISGVSVAEVSETREALFSGPVEPAKRVVDALDGAQVERDDGAAVLVPEAALAADLEITVDKGDENQDKEQKTAQRRQKNIQAVSEEVQYGPEGTLFNAPVTLTLPYDANLASSSKEDDLKVYYWNPAAKDWTALASVVDKENKTVNAQTNHFSIYQVQGPGGAAAAAALDLFSLRDGYAFPNPSRKGAPVTFRIQPGSADSVEVVVYDVSGRKVHASTNFRFVGALDDGNGKGAQNTYDHVWDVSGVGSGVYTFLITAKRAGHPDIRKTGNAGVIK